MSEEEKVGKGEREKGGGGIDNSDTLYVWYISFFRNTEAELKKGVSS